METTQLSSFPPGANPFTEDVYHMGVKLGTNIMIMMPNHVSEVCPYLIVVNIDTGERMKVEFTSGP